MATNAFLDETRTERLDVSLPFAKQLRLSPSIMEVLSEHKPPTQSWGDFCLESMVLRILTDTIMRRDCRGCNRLVVRLFGGNLTGVGSPDGRQKENAR